MQVTLKQSEIEVALKNYIQAMGINLAGKSIDVAFTAGRKEAGISAELDINETGQPQVAYVTPAPIIAGSTTSPELRPAQEFRPSLVSRAGLGGMVLGRSRRCTLRGPGMPLRWPSQHSRSSSLPRVTLRGV